MKSQLFAGKLLVVGGLVLLASVFGRPVYAAADSYHTSDTTPKAVALAPGMLEQLTYASVCSNNAAGTASWSVINPNVNDVTLVWRNAANTSNGTYTAPAKTTTTFTTTYAATAASQNYSFTVPGYNPITVAASKIACAPVVPPVVPCVDGTIRSNLVALWNGSNIFTVHTKNNAPLCSDVTLYASDYILPANYDGSGFGGPTSYPQNLYQSLSKVLAKGTDGSATFTLTLPPACNNTQVDLYYAPEITLVGPNGHGSQFITGGILAKSVTPCVVTPPVTPPTPPVVPTPPTGGLGGGDTPTAPVVTPPAPVVTTAVVTTPAVIAAPAASLVNTGVHVNLVSAFAAGLLGAALFVVTRRTKVSQ